MTTGSGAKQRLERIGQGNDPAQDPFRLTLVQFNKLVTFSNVGGAVEFASTSLCGLPKGDLIVYAGLLSLDVSEDPLTANISNTYTLSASLGTTATADNSLVGTDANLMTLAAATIAAASVTPHIKRVLDGPAVGSIVDAGATTAKYLDNNAGTLACFLNMTLPDADISGLGSLRVKGTIRLLTVGLGKNS